MVDFLYPSAVELRQVAQELVPRLTAAREGFSIFPLNNMDSSILEWEQKDNYKGLQQVRGLNGMPSRVEPIGGKRYLYVPGAYGEFELIDERQITERRPWVTFGGSDQITVPVPKGQNRC